MLRYIDNRRSTPFGDKVGITPTNDRGERNTTLSGYSGGAPKRLQNVENCLHGKNATINVASTQEGSTINAADAQRHRWHNTRMISHAELVDVLSRKLESKETSQAKISRIIGVPTSRVAEIFKPAEGKTPRQIKLDEAKKLVEHFGISEGPTIPPPVPVSGEAVQPLLEAILTVAPSGSPSEASLKALSATLAYGLELIGCSLATPASPDALQVAVRGVISRSRETGLKS